MGLLGEKIHNPLHRLVGIVGVQSGHAQMPGFGVMQRMLHGGPVAYLANHDHVRRLPHRTPQGLVIRRGIEPHLALCHQRFLVGVQVLDGVFHGENMPRRVLVAIVQHRGQCGGLARPGRTDGKHQPTFQEGELFEHRRQAQFVKARNLGRDMADDHPHIAALQVHIDTVARQILRLERKIAFLRGFKLIDLRLAHDRIHHRPDVLGSHRPLGDWQEGPLALERGRCTRQKKKVRSAFAHHQRKARQQAAICRRCLRIHEAS